MITVKIDVTKVDKNRLFLGKNGAKYLDIVLIPTPNDKWGNSHMAVEGITKEERLAGKKGTILGNAKTRGPRPTASAPAPQEGGGDDAPPAGASGDDVPF